MMVSVDVMEAEDGGQGDGAQPLNGGSGLLLGVSTRGQGLGLGGGLKLGTGVQEQQTTGGGKNLLKLKEIIGAELKYVILHCVWLLNYPGLLLHTK